MESETIKRKINILIVANEIFPDAHGGVHTYIYELSNGLAKLGHKVSILTRKVKQDSQPLQNANNITIYRYQTKNYKPAFLGQIANIIKINKEFTRLAQKNNFDIISIHSPHASLGINLSKAAKKIPKVYTFYALLADEELSSASRSLNKGCSWRMCVKSIWFPIYLSLSRWLEKKALNNAEKIISLSDFTSKRLTEIHKIPEAKIVKIAAGVDSERFAPPQNKNSARNSLGLPEDKLILFTVRRLVPRMGLDNLIKAMPVISEKVPNVLLIIGGDGPLCPSLKLLLESLNIQEKVILAGFISDENLPLYYQASDLFILPSIELEGFGIVTLEALSSSLPVLATPVGANMEILNKLDEDLVFKDISPDAMASLIIQYLSNNDKRIKVQNKCREFILENYSLNGLVDKTEKLLLEISSCIKANTGGI